ncbi:hypothetical protein KVR01_013164 [Diaporthe batatas]|uniref:uncharacterized protein n=1 Tax=Diaporthe batatas TaxID=748121 RepID=UPI001D03B1C6|nr:uncharacterized protein KVR01_013164 [Diaporthe batatas]KAG8156942.1 hypothetical protein KVR01_013164 [Diaporthe batatas]
MAPAAQKPLVGHFDWPAMNPPQNSTRPLHHTHYESPFQQVDMRPGPLQSAAAFFSRHFSPSHCAPQRPVVLAVVLVACAVALVALALSLCSSAGRRRGGADHHQRRERLCRRHCYFDDEDDGCDDQDQGFVVCEKEEGEGLLVVWSSETRRGSGAGAGDTGAGGGVSAKPDLPPFHVSVVRSGLI